MEKLKRKNKIVLGIGLILSLIAIILGISIGGASMNPIESLAALFFKGDATENIIIWSIRLPRVLTALLAGGGLAIVGATFQGIFRNPMADPFVLGISSGAALGATIAIVTGINITILSFSGVSVMAFLGGVITVVIIYLVASIKSSRDNNTLLLTGISLNFLFSAVMYLFMFIRYDKMKEIVMWTFGTFSTSSWDKLMFLAPVVLIFSVILILFSRDLNALVLGEKEAHSVGISVNTVRNIIILAGTAITAVIVASSGIIGFVGLMIPHLLRLVIGSDYRNLLPISFIYGGSFLVICDIIARVAIKPGELPIGAITAILGAPFFIFLLLRKKEGLNEN